MCFSPQIPDVFLRGDWLLQALALQQGTSGGKVPGTSDWADPGFHPLLGGFFPVEKNEVNVFLGHSEFHYFWIISRAHQLEAAQAALQAEQSGRTFLVPHGSLLCKQNIAKGHSKEAVYRGFAAPACGRSVVLQPLPWMAVGNVLLSTCTLPFKRTLEVHQILHLPRQNGTGGSPNPAPAMKNGTKGSPNSAHAAKKWS